MPRHLERYHPDDPDRRVFTAQQEAWIEAMVDGATIPQACEATGVSIHAGKEWSSGRKRKDICAEIDRRKAHLADLNAEMREKTAREEALERSITRAYLLEEAQGCLQIAKAEMNASGGIKALEFMAKVCGLMVVKTINEHSGPGGGPIELDMDTEVDFSKLDPDKLEMLARLNLELAGENPENFPT